MKSSVLNYWFTIEPYVYVGFGKEKVLLYNTLDGKTIESEDVKVMKILKNVLQKENHGVAFLSSEELQDEVIGPFIVELREKYMGDIIEVSLSEGKPVQLLPLFDYLNFDKFEIYKRHNFSLDRNVLDKLFEITLHIGPDTNIAYLIDFLKYLSAKVSFNIVGNLEPNVDFENLLSFLDNRFLVKNIVCTYTNISLLDSWGNYDFSYIVIVDFPINLEQWIESVKVLLNQGKSFEYIFNVSSLNDCQQVELLAKQYRIENYRIKPVYTGDNMLFFEENVFLTKEDILSGHISIKNIFANQLINTYDFGKINIMSNGDVYANMNHPLLGNIYIENLHNLIWKEITCGKSWRRIRNQLPCCECVYQWLCPSPSDYEIEIGRPNLCHVK